MEQVSPGEVKTHLKPKGLRWVLIAAVFVFWNWARIGFLIFLEEGVREQVWRGRWGEVGEGAGGR